MIRAPLRIESLEAETYRSLRTTLSYSRLPEGRRVVMFTSALRGEGKSTTAANFAAVCAYGEQPTLLVDADLRNPQLDHVFTSSPTDGLATVLATSNGKACLADVALATRVPSLDLLPAGGAVANAAELLSRPRLAALVEEARAAYGWVIVDAPPVLPIADAAIISRVVDGVVLVVDVGKTSVAAARRARDLLRAVDAPLLGLVANNCRAKHAASYGYGRYPG